MKVATVWGAGFVGETAYTAFQSNPEWKVVAWDVDPGNSRLGQMNNEAKFVSKEEALKSDLHLVCVPTPMRQESGECNVSIVESVVREIASASPYAEIVIKSTVPVGTCERLAQETKSRILFNPEFLTEANAFEDFVNLEYQIFGFTSTYKAFLTNLHDLYEGSKCFRKIKYYHKIGSQEAELVKLTRNCYLAVRLSFFNEIKQFCDKAGVDFYDVVTYAGLDKRVGAHYNKVPGPDGKPGFSKSCLPKDLNNLMFAMESVGVKPKVLLGAWTKNLEVRPEKDWELESKAVTKKR